MSFGGELKRRKVFRLAGAYLVVAWLVLQVAATLLPILDFPAWVVKLVAVILIIGFPAALILGWIFDITPRGVERTSASDFHFPTRAASAATLVVIAGVTGFFVVRHRLNAAGIDDNAVVILPFRITGDAQLAAMREGMVDLIAPKLTGEGGPRAVDSRTTLSAWRRAVDSESDDLTPREAIKLARTLGAGHVILGDVVGARGEIALNARVYSTIDGAASDPAQVRASPDSVLNAVDALVTELLTRQAGEHDRLAELLTESLPAVQAYLDGQRTYRLGKYQDAAKHYALAVDMDSTFALAAFGEMLARGWTGWGPRYSRAVTLAHTFRNRLPSRERAMVVGWYGDDLSKSFSQGEYVRQMERLSSEYPDSPEVWYELGDAYFHGGAQVGIDDYEERARLAWNRSIALDSTYAAPWEHQMDIHAARRDTAQLRAVFARLKQLKAERVEGSAAWMYAAVMDDDTLRARLLKAAPKWPPPELFQSILLTSSVGGSPAGLDELANLLYNDPSLPTDRRILAKIQGANYSMERGRPKQGLRYLAEAEALHRKPERTQAALVGYGILYPEIGREVSERAVKALRAHARTNPLVACDIGLYEASNGRVAEMQAALKTQIESLSQVTDYQRSYLEFCIQLTKAALAVVNASASALREVERADSLIANGPHLSGDDGADYSGIILILPRLYERLGEAEKARLAAQRGANLMPLRMPRVLELARAAARAGRHEQAIRNYRVYLSYRDPEDGPARNFTDKVRAELAALASH